MYRSPNVDVIHITSPNRVHVEQSLAALAAGKHVVCEKPLGMTARETARIVRAAARPGAPVFAVNYMCRFFPAVLQMRAMVQRGDLGPIMHVQGHFFQDWLLQATDYNWRLLASEGGKLRAVGDIGTHWIDAVSFILGAKAGRVFAHLETFHKTRKRPKGPIETFAGKTLRPEDYVEIPIDTEDFGGVMFRMGDRTRGVYTASQVSAGRKNRLSIEIYGSKCGVAWDQDGNPLVLAILTDSLTDQDRQLLKSYSCFMIFVFRTVCFPDD
jgi:predicted dehydrogenase